MNEALLSGTTIRDRVVELRRVPASELRANPANARRHPRAQRQGLQDMLAQIGFAGAVLARETPEGLELIDGHLRADLAGEEDVPVLVLDVDADEALTLLATLDPLAAMAQTDQKAMGELLEAARIDSDALLAYLGDLAGLEEAEAGSVPEDEVPEPPAKPITKPGDVWLLGDHRLICGDSTDPATIERLMAGASARMMFTDPPWNVAIGGDKNPRHRQREGLENDDLSPEDFQAFLDAFARVIKPHVTGDIYCVLGASEWPRLDATLRSQGYHWSATIIWVKDTFVLGRSKYHRRYEPIWYGWASRSSFGARRDLDDVWEVPRPKRSEEHPTMKPVALVARAVASSSRKGDFVLDPFGGSGSTLAACEHLGRRCYTAEIDPGYADVIVRRFENLTGDKAVRA